MRAPALRILLPLAAVVVVLIVVATNGPTPDVVDESTREPGAAAATPVGPPAPVPPSPELIDLIERAIADISEDATAEQIGLLVRGLMSDDDALALRCAAALQWDWLSGPEMKRAVGLLWPALTFEEKALVDFEELRSMAGSSELPAMLRTLPTFGHRGNAEYVLTEGGSVRVGAPDRPDVWGVTVTEKSPCWLALSVRGRTGHTSTPTPDAAVPQGVMRFA